jgi:parallel beta-helix repeat protein
MVFSLVLSSVTMAAEAVVGAQISNELQAEITVEEGETPEKSIQDLINAAAAEGTVEVPAGIYEEDIIIEKSLTLKPAGDVQVTIRGHVTVKASNVTVQGFTIKKTQDQPAITLSSGSEIEIMGNTIDGAENADTSVNGSGIRVKGGTSATIEGNTIVNNSGNGIWVDLGSGDELTIKGNTIEDNRTGINFNSSQAESVSILENTFETNSAHGISIGANTTATTFTITGNTFDGNQRSHFSDRRYNAENDETVSPSREDIVKNNIINGRHAWAWNGEGARWLLVPVQENMLVMSWDEVTDGTVGDDDVLTVSVKENEEKSAAVKTEFVDNPGFFTEEGNIKEIGKVLFIMEIKDKEGNFVGNDVLTATGTDGQSLGYDAQDKFWYWGPRQGFSFKEEATTEFTYSFKQADEYSVKIYAVQLTE